MKITLLGEVHDINIQSRIWKRLRKEIPEGGMVLREFYPSSLFNEIERPAKKLKEEEETDREHLQYEAKRLGLAWGKKIEYYGMDIPISIDPFSLWAYNPSLKLEVPQDGRPAIEAFRRYVSMAKRHLENIPDELSPRTILTAGGVMEYLIRQQDLHALDLAQLKRIIIRGLTHYRSIIFALSILERVKETSQHIYAIMGRDHIPVVKHLLEKEGLEVSTYLYGVPLEKYGWVAERDGTLSKAHVDPKGYARYLRQHGFHPQTIEILVEHN